MEHLQPAPQSRYSPPMASKRKSKPIKPAAGVIVTDPDKPKPRPGERAALVRKLHCKYPELSKADLARRAGCSPQAVSETLAKFLGDTPLEELRDYQANKADILDVIGMRSIGCITQAKLDKTSAPALATTYGILFDKAQLLRGQPTSINMTAFVDVLEAIKAQQG